MQLSRTFKIGDAVTVLNGHSVACPEGCHVIGEYYSELKGMPMLVMGNDWPYLACKFVVGNGGKVLDLRLCDVTKCSEEYVMGFRMMFPASAAGQAVMRQAHECGGTDPDESCVGK